jgi:hypothetical protein
MTPLEGGVAVGRMGSWSKGTSSLCQMVDYIIDGQITLCIFDHLPQWSFVDCVQFVDCILFNVWAFQIWCQICSSTSRSRDI